MRLANRFHVTLTVAAMSLAGKSWAACEPPTGFVNPPRPDIAPLDQMLSHTEENVIARPLAAESQSAARPLEEAIRATRDLPGVSGTFRLSNGPYGTPGARRLVCLTDGSIVVEELLLTDSNDGASRFRYLVWNYTSPKFRDVEYAVGEFIRTAPAPDQTHVRWTYRFTLKDYVGPEAQERFRKEFLDGIFAEWMRSQMQRGKAYAEATR
jgi:hypothetical protein